MRKLIEYIEKNLGNSDITIDDMAYAVAVSRSGLHRKMKHLLGTSPIENTDYNSLYLKFLNLAEPSPCA